MKYDHSLNFLFIVLLLNCFSVDECATSHQPSFDNETVLLQLDSFSKKYETWMDKIRSKSKLAIQELRLIQIKKELKVQNSVFIQESSAHLDESKMEKQTHLINKDITEMITLSQETKAKSFRFISMFLIVSICSTLSFLLVKSSVDWAGNSRIELNRMRDEELTRITEEINQKYQINKSTD